MASAGVPGIDSLPPEMLDTIFGFLDVGALCTARLVCAQFRGAASRFLHSVELSVETLRSRPETTLNNFPNLSRVCVFGVRRDGLLMLAQSPVADAITHLRAVSCLRPVPQSARTAAGLPLLPLPNLTSLTVGYTFYDAFPFPQSLRELSLRDPVSLQTANLVAGLTNLTSLRINVLRMPKPFKAVTALTALQRLEIYGELSLVPFVAELTLLTHLHFEGVWRRASRSDLPALASLARLDRLVHLGLKHIGIEDLGALESHVVASISRFTNLRSLDMELCRRPQQSVFETLCMTPLSQLTALTLESRSRGLDASFLPRFNLERLRDLSLSCGVQLDRDGVIVLRRATSLTHLHLWSTTVGASVGVEDLEIALSRMSQLRALSLGTPNYYEAMALGTTNASNTRFFLKSIGLLTELTRLVLSGWGVTTNADAVVCVGLTKLRVLRIEVPWGPHPAPSDRITPETFFAVAKLPELRKFDILGNVGILREDLTDSVWLNTERLAKGWPPLELSVVNFVE